MIDFIYQRQHNTHNYSSTQTQAPHNQRERKREREQNRRKRKQWEDTRKENQNPESRKRAKKETALAYHSIPYSTTQNKRKRKVLPPKLYIIPNTYAYFFVY